MLTKRLKPIFVPFFVLLLCAEMALSEPIDRYQLVNRNSPVSQSMDATSPFSVGNGKFTFTADVTGLQSFSDYYYENGVPLETKARWAWHSRENPENYTLSDASEILHAYERDVSFPINMDSDAGQWLRQNPHDLPLARFSLFLNGKKLEKTRISEIQQTLNLWKGKIRSKYRIAESPVEVQTLVHPNRDAVAFKIQSANVDEKKGLPDKLSVSIRFPRGYDLKVKNNPDLLWTDAENHVTRVVSSEKNSAVFYRVIDDAKHWLRLNWVGNARLNKLSPHHFELQIADDQKNPVGFSLVAEFSESDSTKKAPLTFKTISELTTIYWEKFWQSGAAMDFSGSTDPAASELERRIILSQYLLQMQSRAAFPAQETGLTSSSWYGKHHTEMTVWHAAHWVPWGRPENAELALNWFVEHLSVAKATAEERGLKGARWSKMIGPDGRESPGGNPLIIWNQPGPIFIAELLYEKSRSPLESNAILQKYAELVEETAEAISAMLVWETKEARFSLTSPIWIAQEIYDPALTKNPSFELSFWRDGLVKAQEWRKRLGKAPNKLWQAQVEKLAALPQKDGKYVAIESIPDTFDRVESRSDHPSMLASWGLLADDRVDEAVMSNTLNAVLSSWDWEERIWGWDYPMIAMTALKLGESQKAVDILLSDKPNNLYLNNGHCPQSAANLPVYLPANGSLLLAVSQFADEKYKSSKSLGFPTNGKWFVRAEGF